MISTLSRSASLLALSILLSPLSDFQANARWMTEDEADIEGLNKKTVFKVNKDGSWEMEMETELRALTDLGRQILSTQNYTYDAALQKFEVLEAKTIGITEDSKIQSENVVPFQKIEDKPLASDPQRLGNIHQILVPFECVTVGSTIHTKIKQQCFKPQVENYFGLSIGFQGNCLWRHNHTVIESEVPLFLKSNNPRNCLDIRERKEDSKYIYEITLTKPLFEGLTGESFSSHVEPSLYTSCSISTEENYERLGKIAGKLNLLVLESALPENLGNIISIASEISDEAECIDTIVTYLIDKIRYVQCRDTAENFIAPRSLEAIISSGYGDCKEYSACLAAILNRLGYTAKVAWVYRDEVYLEKDEVPNLHSFDHAIVKVTGPSGQTYWVDPTNAVTMASGIFPDIADRPVLVGDPENPIYERTPPITHRHALTYVEESIILANNGRVHREGSISYEGETAYPLTERFSSQASSIVKEEIVKAMSYSSAPINPLINFSENSSRTVKPLKGIFSYEEDHIMTRTNYGDAFPLRSNWVLPYTSVSETDEGALYVGHPQTIVKKQIFKNVSAEGLDELAFSIQTPWLNAKRELMTAEEDIVVTETVEQLKSLISAKDLKSEKYRELKKTLLQNGTGVAIIFSKHRT